MPQPQLPTTVRWKAERREGESSLPSPAREAKETAGLHSEPTSLFWWDSDKEAAAAIAVAVGRKAGEEGKQPTPGGPHDAAISQQATCRARGARAKTRKLHTHPEDKIEDEKQIFDAFGTAFHSHRGGFLLTARIWPVIAEEGELQRTAAIADGGYGCVFVWWCFFPPGANQALSPSVISPPFAFYRQTPSF